MRSEQDYRSLSRREFLKLGGGAMAFAAAMGAAPRLASSEAAAAAGKRKPNVVFILADDLGWRDTSLYGSAFYETPNIERLAKRGMMFTQAYAANPLCSPTRSSIMTGLYPARIGITTPSCHLPEERLRETVKEKAPAMRKALDDQSATRLKLEYVTLAESLKAAGYATAHFGKWHLGPEPYDPLHQGFDVDLPHTSAPGPAGGYFAPWKFKNFPSEPGEHIEDRMAKEAVKFIRERKDGPFYVNYWHFSVHSPWVVNGVLQAKKDLIEKYRKKVDPKNPQHNAMYAGMVETLDTSVGKILDTLDELGLAENTVIVFFSDNGGVHFQEIDGAPVTSNSPLRGGKATIYEGGTREPCVVVWPGVVKPGTKNDTLIQSIDFHPTILDMLGLKPRPDQKFDGMSVVPALEGQPLGRDTIYCFFPHYGNVDNTVPSAYVRKGDWKLIRFFFDNEDQTDRFELYNLKEDLGETKDLAAKEPERVKEMNALLDHFLKNTSAVMPKPNPAYKPGALETIKGWHAAGTCSLGKNEGVLRVNSTGVDPQVTARAMLVQAGPYVVKMRLKSAGEGPGQVFWTVDAAKKFGPTARVNFEIVHDGAWREYEVAVPEKGKMGSLRIDPGAGPGEIEFQWVRVCKPDGTVLKSWDFQESVKGADDE